MVLSYKFSLSSLTDSLRSFILSIGKSRARENLRNREFTLRDKVVNTSLFVLADPKNLNEII